MEKPFDEQASLKLIQEMIDKTKEGFQDNGFFFLLWGWLVFIAAFAHFTLLQIDFQYHWIGWPSLMTLGGIISGVYGYRDQKTRGATTYMHKSMGYLWGGFCIALLITLGAMVKVGPENAYPFIMLLYGVGTFVSGGMLSFRPLIIGGILCFGCAIAAFFLPFTMQLVLIAFAVLVSYIIPGHILKAQYNNV